MRKLLVIWVFLLLTPLAWAQETFPRNDVKDQREKAYALKNAMIIADYQTVINNGLMLIRDGKIEYVGNTKTIPAGYIEIDLTGKRIYPSLIEAYSNYGLPKVERPRGGGWGSQEQMQSKTKGAYNANQAIRAEYSAASEFSIDSKSAANMRKIGFGSANTFKADGLARGTSAFVTFGEDSDNNALLNETAAAHFSFDRGTSQQNYPRSAMGFIAVLRQTYLDAQWYDAQNPKPFKDQTLDRWIDSQSIPQIFDTRNWLEVGRADKIGDEFGVQYIIKGSGDEYKRLDEIRASGAQMIIPLNFPDAYDVDDPVAAQSVSLAEMKHWELAPTNLSRMNSAGLSFAITSSGVKPTVFWKNLRKAIDSGLPEQVALKALTDTPAKMLKAESMVGSLSSGKLANFIITSDNLFSDKNVIHENWVRGEKFVINALDVSDNSGKYKLEVDGSSLNVEIAGDPGKQSGNIIINDTTKIKFNTKFKETTISGTFSPKGEDGIIRLTGWKIENGWKGNGENISGEWISWTMTRTGDVDKKEKGKKGDRSKGSNDLGAVIFPFVAHGSTTLPQTETILIKNATVWTSDEAGVLENTDVLLKDGKISEVGKNLSSSGAVEVDGTGKHVTPGIIDEHSHIGASSINDVAVNSGMVRIGDVLDPEQINIYRALSGGVVAIQILHGSANPIGGQSALVKMRWGESPENMKISGADGFIKFALGENVKRSSSNTSIRYPRTRMGVEQVFMDAFSSAKEYEKRWNTYNGLSKKVKAATAAPRRDLADETMLEIVNSQRFISCHSYVQSEINMLMDVADKFDFKVNTFTHILEGYKVADKMAEHGVGGSTFSDWWAYKWEVRYAIPQNATIMHNAGVTVAINSDDASMIRRLNQEAAKSVKYGGMDEIEALKMVTINPAKLLHLDDRMGSIKVGKDADVVLWSGHPLSVYSIAEKTIVDGKVYYDLEKDKANRSYTQTERARLIQKMKGAKKSGAPTQRGGSRIQLDFHCDDVKDDSITY